MDRNRANSRDALRKPIRQYDSSDTGHSDNVNIAGEPAEVLSQLLDNTSNSPVYGEYRYKCC